MTEFHAIASVSYDYLRIGGVDIGKDLRGWVAGILTWRLESGRVLINFLWIEVPRSGNRFDLSDRLMVCID